MKKSHWIIIVIVAAVVIAGIAAAIVIPKLNQAADSADIAEGSAISAKVDLKDASTALTIDGEEMTMGEFCCQLIYSKNMYEANYGEIADWTAESADGSGLEVYEAVKEQALANVRMHAALLKIAAANGVMLTAEQESELSAAWDALVENFGSEEDVLAAVESYYGSRETYEYYSEHSYLYQNSFAALYGEKAETLTDDEVLEYVAQDGYLQAKHILFSTMDDSGNAVSNSEKETIRAKAQSVLDEIRAYDGDDLVGYFDSLVAEYSTDAGGTEGYLFQNGDMVTEFYSAALALAEYEVSELVETAYGYHIILRVPIDPDFTPTAYAKQGYSMSLRMIVADDMFFDAVTAVGENLDIQLTKTCEDLNAATLFVD